MCFSPSAGTLFLDDPMNEMNRILAARDECQRRGEPCALALLVRVQGSHYRKPGARSLILRNGKIIGSIGGGCLDNDLILHAREVMNSGLPKLLRYDSTSSDDIIFGMGIGCGGIADILLEPVQPGQPDFTLSAIRDGFHKKKPVTIVTVMDSASAVNPPAGRMIMKYNNELLSAFDDPEISDIFGKKIQNILARGETGFIKLAHEDRTIGVFVEKIRPPLHLLIIGGGNDAAPLTTLAKTLGWEVTIADHRPDYASQERFPLADRILNITPEKLETQLELHPPEAVVILTHHFQHDLELLRILLPLQLPYMGLLGSRTRTDQLLETLEKDGFVITEAMLSRFFSPVGLDIHADSPAEIALAAAAEIQQTLRKK